MGSTELKPIEIRKVKFKPEKDIIIYQKALIDLNKYLFTGFNRFEGMQEQSSTNLMNDDP